MKIFINSAILKEIEWALERNIVDGITTNPSLLAKADRKLSEVINDILQLDKNLPVFINIVSKTQEEIIDEAKAISKLGKNVVVNVPMSDEGLLAVQKLAAKGIRTSVSLIFSPAQALLAARAGAIFICQFLYNREKAGNSNGIQEVQKTIKIFENSSIKSFLVVMAVQSPSEVEQASLVGADAVAIPFGVLTQMYRHEATEAGAKKFLEDWDRIAK